MERDAILKKLAWQRSEWHGAQLSDKEHASRWVRTCRSDCAVGSGEVCGVSDILFFSQVFQQCSEYKGHEEIEDMLSDSHLSHDICVVSPRLATAPESRRVRSSWHC